MTRFHIEHLTRYRYAQSVALNYGEARMLPRDTPGQRVLDSRLELHPSIDDRLDEVLKERHGVCQDFAHLALAARYVSGYLETTPPPSQARQVGADATHAWIAVWLPGLGWFDFDPTNGIAAGEGHLTLAWGRDFGDVTPLKGVIHGGGTHTLEVAVTVTRLDDKP